MSLLYKTQISSNSLKYRPTAPYFSQENRGPVVEEVHENGLVPSPYYLDGRDVHDKYTTVVRSAQYTFNGVDQYATIPDWTPNGLPFEVSVEAVPLTVGDTNKYMLDGPGNEWMRLDITTSVFRGSVVDTAGVPRPVSTAYEATSGERISASLRGDGGDLLSTANGFQQAGDGNPIDIAANVFNVIASNNGVNSFWHGPIWQLRLTDNSPIQDTTACMGNGTRYVQLDNPIVLDGDFEIEFDWIRQDSAVGNSYTAMLGSKTGAAGLACFINDTGEATQPDRFAVRLNGGDININGAFSNIAQGQHCHVRFYYSVGNERGYLELDGAPAGNAARAATALPCQIDGIGYRDGAGGNRIPANSALQNVIIRDLDKALTWHYKLDEGEGLDAINTDPSTQGNYLNQPLWDRATLDGDNSRSVSIPGFTWAANDEYRIKAACIRQDRGGVSNGYVVGQSGGSDDGLSVYDVGSSSPNDVALRQGGAFKRRWTGALEDIAQGQHYTLEVLGTVSAADAELFIDGVSKGLASGAGMGTLSIGYIGSINGSQPVFAGGSVGNVILENLTTGEYVEYRIDEGAGTVVKAYDKQGNEIGPVEVLERPLSEYSSGGTWSTNGSVVTRNTSTSGFIQLNTMEAIVAGQVYRCQFDVTGLSGDDFFLRVGTSTSADGRVSANGSYDLLLTATDNERPRFAGWAGTAGECTISNIVITRAAEGTITPDAAWTQQPLYSNDGEWTPDTDWQFIPNNSRHYPMNEGEGSVLKDIIGGHDGTLINFDEDSWG